MRKKIIVSSAILVLAIQFIQVDRSNPPVKEKMQVPAAVSEMLRRSCFDCHSNETRWPWYSHVAPVSWLLSHHVQEARDHLNFSTWNEVSEEQRSHIAREIWEEVSEGNMPLRGYLLLHPKAKLSAAEKEELSLWAK